jgi:PadR family transcriptional regulator, regulatory protein PadR
MESLDQMRKGTTTLAILKLLIDAEEPMHGYQIARALEGRSQGSFQFKEGLLYPRLHQMEHDGLLRSEWEGERGSRRRKVYRPTTEGKQRLAEELKQWQAFLLSMGRLLGLAE